MFEFLKKKKQPAPAEEPVPEKQSTVLDELPEIPAGDQRKKEELPPPLAGIPAQPRIFNSGTGRQAWGPSRWGRSDQTPEQFPFDPPIGPGIPASEIPQVETGPGHEVEASVMVPLEPENPTAGQIPDWIEEKYGDGFVRVDSQTKPPSRDDYPVTLLPGQLRKRD